MIILCCQTTSIFDDISKISNIIIAVLTLFLGFYVFIYQRKKDKQNDIESIANHKKSIRIKWFKDLIIEPKIELLFQFYDNISGIQQKIKSNELEEDDKISLITFIKKEQSVLRKSFLNLIQHINLDLFNEISDNLDKMTDDLTNAISNDEFKLNNNATYEREINSKIQSSYNFVLSKIFNYSG